MEGIPGTKYLDALGNTPFQKGGGCHRTRGGDRKGGMNMKVGIQQHGMSANVCQFLIRLGLFHFPEFFNEAFHLFCPVLERGGVNLEPENIG